ncbi:DUF3039 domain-containing protein [Egicoccus sp. AB-alg6-2]|uniref:DUF3039 domain-containing protein n=1 Tax=Egicoccus sp. AB-alg6-2 TaxID=3242692 RepID=UPI00359D92D6
MAPTHLPTRQTPVVEPEVRESPQTGEPGDHDRFTHYVRQRELERSRRTGKPVTALCGKKWIPDGDPSKYPMCPTCSEIVAESFSRGLE